jgi:hypothetical protein
MGRDAERSRVSETHPRTDQDENWITGRWDFDVQPLFEQGPGIAEYFEEADQFAGVVKFIAFNSDFDAWLALYLFVTKVFMANPELRQTIDTYGTGQLF